MLTDGEVMTLKTYQAYAEKHICISKSRIFIEEWSLIDKRLLHIEELMSESYYHDEQMVRVSLTDLGRIILRLSE